MSNFSAARGQALDFGQLVGKFLVRRFCARSLPTRFAVTLMNKIHHVVERRSCEKNFVHAFASDDRSVLMRDGPPAAAENLDVIRAFFAQKIDNLGEKLDVS